MKRTLKHILLASTILAGSFCYGGCRKRIIEYVENPPTIPYEPPSQNNPQPPAPTYNNVTGLWRLKTGDDFGNSLFIGSFSANLNLSQSTQLKEGYTKDIYKVNGSFTDLTIGLQKKSNGNLYLIAQNGYGNILEGGINVDVINKLISFNIGTSDFRVTGVAPGYNPMWGDITARLNLGPADGIVTVTGTWDATRK